MVRNSRRNCGELAQRRFQFVAPLGAGLAGGAGVGEEAGDVLALTRERLRIALGVGGELGQFVALFVEDLEQAVSVAQGRVGALDRLPMSLAAAGEAGAEFVEDEAEALCVGQASGCR